VELSAGPIGQKGAPVRIHQSGDFSTPAFGRFAGLFLALFVVAAIPVFSCDSLPLFDYPNHLARMHILRDLSHSPTLQQFYEVAWRPLPNLAMDAIVPVLGRVMPLAWAGKVFVLLTLFLLACGPAILHRVLFGAWSAWSCLAFLLLYSRTLLWGFLNYLFGLGLALVALALWLALARRPVALRLVAGVVLGLALFFAHLLAFGLYGVMVMGYEAGRILRGRASLRQGLADLVIAGLGFLPALGVLVLGSPTSMSGEVRWGHLARKIDLLFSVFDNYDRGFDIACFVLVMLALLFVFWRGWARIAPDIAVPLGLLAVVYLAMPSQLATASGSDHRIPLLIGLVVIAGSRWVGPAAPQRLFLAAALLMFLLRLAVVTASWTESDRIYASLLPAVDAIPVGSRVAVAYPAEALNSEAAPLAHFPTLAILRRDAFVPTLFAFPTQQPVLLRPAYRLLADRLPPERLWAAFVAGGPPLDGEDRAAFTAYDDIVFVGRAPFSFAASPGLTPVFTAPRFALFRIDHGARLDAPGPSR
jgi:hypothetical protein